MTCLLCHFPTNSLQVKTDIAAKLSSTGSRQQWLNGLYLLFDIESWRGVEEKCSSAVLRRCAESSETILVPGTQIQEGV